MSGVGFWELIILLLIGLIVLGPERLPRVANQLGTWIGQARRMTRVMKRQLEEELNLEREPGIRPARLSAPQPRPQPQPAPPPSREYDDSYSPAHGPGSVGTGVGTDRDPGDGASDSRRADDTDDREETAPATADDASGTKPSQ